MNRRGAGIVRAALTVAALVVVAATADAQPESSRAADEAAIRGVVDAFLATRDGGDAAALGELLTADADQQVTSGRLRSGRAAVVEGSLATTRETGGRRTITLDRIRFLTSDVAIADGRYDIVDRTDGPDRHYRTTFVLQRIAGEWKIAAIRNMQPTE